MKFGLTHPHAHSAILFIFPMNIWRYNDNSRQLNIALAVVLRVRKGEGEPTP